MYRSSLTMAFVVLYSAAAAASDIYVAPGGIYAPSADVYVRPAPAYRQPHAEPGYGYRQPSYGPAYRAPAAVYGEYGSTYPAQPVYVERAPAYREPYYAREPYDAGDHYYGESRDYALEYAPRPPASVPYRSRARCDDGYGRLTYCD